MLRGVGDIGRWRRTGLVLVAFALMVRILVPAGYMAAAGAGGAPAIVICTGEGALAITVEADGTARKTPVDDGHSDTSQSDHPCAFAGATTPLAAPSLALAAAPLAVEAAAAPSLPAHQRPGLGLAAPPPPTTGPPLLV